MFEKLLKFFILAALMIAIPVVWWKMAPWQGRIKDFLFSTGGSLFLLGLCYKLMGSWDLIPDWIPFLGSMDDSVAWIVMLLGVVVGGIGLWM